MLTAEGQGEGLVQPRVVDETLDRQLLEDLRLDEQAAGHPRGTAPLLLVRHSGRTQCLVVPGNAPGDVGGGPRERRTVSLDQSRRPADGGERRVGEDWRERGERGEGGGREREV